MDSNSRQQHPEGENNANNDNQNTNQYPNNWISGAQMPQGAYTSYPNYSYAPQDGQMMPVPPGVPTYGSQYFTHKQYYLKARMILSTKMI